MVESFNEKLVWGTATYALELFQAAPALDVVYVQIGMGSSICGMVAARNALNLATEIVGVTSDACRAAAISFKERKLVEAPATSMIADGLACRTPNQDALEVIWAQVAGMVEVSTRKSRRRCASTTRIPITLPKAPEPLHSRPR